MKFTGSRVIGAPRDRVWAVLIDPHRVGSCAPGLESIEVLDATHARARAKAGAGFFAVRVVVDLELADLVAPESLVVRAHGKAPGTTIDGSAAVRLTDAGAAGTRLDWDAEVAIAGALAGLAGRMAGTAADDAIDGAIDCLARSLEA